jgi:hypothetical protein
MTQKHSFQTRSGLRLGFWILTGLIFLKSKRSRFNRKNQSQRVATGSYRVTGSHQVFSFSIFYSTQFQPRVNPSGRTEFQNHTQKLKVII